MLNTAMKTIAAHLPPWSPIGSAIFELIRCRDDGNRPEAVRAVQKIMATPAQDACEAILKAAILLRLAEITATPEQRWVYQKGVEDITRVGAGLAVMVTEEKAKETAAAAMARRQDLAGL